MGYHKFISTSTFPINMYIIIIHINEKVGIYHCRNIICNYDIVQNDANDERTCTINNITVVWFLLLEIS